MAAAVSGEIIRKVSEVYDWIDLQVVEAGRSAGKCEVCGRCCDFETYGHKLFVTSVEVLHFSAAHGGALKEMTGGRCPYNVGGKCASHESRFAGCRVFSCKGDTDFQSGLTGAALKRFKDLCIEYAIPYRYTDLARALNRGAAGTCL